MTDSLMAQWFAAIGVLLGAGIPLDYGAWTLFSFWSRPAPPPGMAQCGMQVIGGLSIITIRRPVGTIVFAGVGAVIGRIGEMIVERFHRK